MTPWPDSCGATPVKFGCRPTELPKCLPSSCIILQYRCDPKHTTAELVNQCHSAESQQVFIAKDDKKYNG